MILLNRNKKPVDKYILEVDSDDDIRENVINYDEEGAGELASFFFFFSLLT